MSESLSFLPDIAVCDNCLMDIKSSENRRYEYVFANCTNCCPVCGPKYYMLNRNGEYIECENPILKARQLLCEGMIIAIKGIGGYHLVCNAQDDAAISALRSRKNRPHKPFAVMASSVDAVKEICFLNTTEEETITNNIRPIVLLNKKSNSILSKSIAPGLSRCGVMLPYTPLHYFLFDETLKYLVMTSGNISGMPICYKDEDALKNLNHVADYFLIHNREIMTPIDDSVVKVLDNDVLISRCGRGYSPAALPLKTPYKVISLGGQQKSSVCFVSKGTAHISQYLGDLGDPDAMENYIHVIDRLARLLNARPQYFAHDLHPNYFSTQYVKKLGKEAIAVQHHHAHMAGCMAEHGLTDDVIGIIYDGTGLGTDGAVWGGEFLVGNRANFKRAGHLEYVLIQGAESAIKEPWKCAACYLHSLSEDLALFFPEIEKFKIEVLRKALLNQVNCFRSSSMGRLFDCIAAMALSRTHISYDAQAAIELESIVDNAIYDYYNYSIYKSDAEGALILSYKEIIKGVLEDLKIKKPRSLISTKFHNAICKATVACAVALREKYRTNHVVLSGGVFENSYLLKNVQKELKTNGFYIYYNKQVPINDGGLSFGQAAAAASILEEKAYVPGSAGKDNICTR